MVSDRFENIKIIIRISYYDCDFYNISLQTGNLLSGQISKSKSTNELGDTKLLSDGKASVPRALGNVQYPFIAITASSTLTRSRCTLYMGKIELFIVYYIPYLLTPSLGQDITQGQFLSGV